MVVGVDAVAVVDALSVATVVSVDEIGVSLGPLDKTSP